MILLWVGLASAAEACGLEVAITDRNCNGVPAEAEPLVDAEDADCAAWIAAWTPAATADAWWAYDLYGCTYPLQNVDFDEDGLGGGIVLLYDETGEVDRIFVLTCDVCPADYDPLQPDADCDAVGDVCDNCVHTPNTDQADDEFDGIGDACDLCPHDPGGLVDRDDDQVGDECDVCPTVPDDQRDRDRDGVGDACDVCPGVADDQRDVDGDGRGDACEGGACHDGLSGGGCAPGPGAVALLPWLGALRRRRGAMGRRLG